VSASKEKCLHSFICYKKASHIFKCNLFICRKVLCSVLTNLENICLYTRVCFFFVRSVEQQISGYGHVAQGH
jgi:hypothetical protein